MGGAESVLTFKAVQGGQRGDHKEAGQLEETETVSKKRELLLCVRTMSAGRRENADVKPSEK
jgi:hypothetical protein